MKIIETAAPQCPECIANQQRAQEQHLFLLSEGCINQCALCGWARVHKAIPGTPAVNEIEVPPFLERLIKSLVIRNMFTLDSANGNSFVAANEPAISPGTTIGFEHREVMISGCMTWYQVAAGRNFQQHETDFAAIGRFAPLPSALIREFVKANSFLVSEAPGKEGRGLRNAGIRFLRYADVTTGSGKTAVTKTYYIRAYLTWDLNYRRLPDGSVEKIAK